MFGGLGLTVFASACWSDSPFQNRDWLIGQRFLLRSTLYSTDGTVLHPSIFLDGHGPNPRFDLPDNIYSGSQSIFNDLVNNSTFKHEYPTVLHRFFRLLSTSIGAQLFHR